MYEKGDVAVTIPPCQTYDAEKGHCTTPGHDYEAHAVEDWSLQGEPKLQHVAYLPHSCELWVIGGPVQIRDMIADLQTALATLEED